MEGLLDIGSLSGMSGDSIGSSDAISTLGSSVGSSSNSPLSSGTSQSASNNGTSILGLSLSRVAAAIVGIICIGAGLLMFKQTQIVIQTAGKIAKKSAEGAAIA
jgi:hypothetical protein